MQKLKDFEIIILILQVISLILSIGKYFINSQTLEIQRAIYDFEPQINGFVKGVIWVHGCEATANIEISIISPHAGNFTLLINNFYPYKQYIDLKPSLTPFGFKEKVGNVTFPQTCIFKRKINLLAQIYPKPNISESYFPIGVLEFKLLYYDVAKNEMYTKLFNESV